MFLPQFKICHQNLHTSYLNLADLINFLKNDLFIGYIQTKVSEKEFLVFLDHGQILNSFEIVDNEYKILPLEEILNTIKEEGTVNVYYLPEETALFWANLATAEILYPNLSTDFTDLIKLMHKLKKEEVTGWTEITSSQGEKSFICFQNGTITGTCSSWRKWVFEESEKYLPEITEKASEAIFNVYKLRLDKTPANITLEEITNFFQEYLATLEKLLGKKEFSLLWRQKSIEKVVKYPFLDPFANEFKYKEGKIVFEGNATQKELIGALKEVCEEMIQEKKDLKKNIIQETQDLKEKYKTFIGNTGLSFFLGT